MDVFTIFPIADIINYRNIEIFIKRKIITEMNYFSKEFNKKQTKREK